MLFDLRSRGRRRTVQVLYLGLALLMGGGLVLFGVGAGNGFGGILNAFNGSGSSAQKQQVSAQQKQAIAQTKADPTSTAAWESLVQADYAAAGQGNNFNTATNAYTTSGKAELASAMVAWQKYLTLTKHPDPTLAVLAARAYDAIAQYKNETTAWQIVTAANPSVSTYYQDLAVAAYQGKQLSLGDLAAAKAVSLVPKAQQFELRQQLKQYRAEIVPSSASTSTATTSSTTASTTSKSTKTGTKAKKK
jgi:hypothetical protein